MFSLNKSVVNFFSLATIQASNALFPIIAYPYALYVIGSDLYAKYAIAESIGYMALAIALYSFEVDGVSRVVYKKESIKAISKIYSSIFYSRILLLGLSYVFVALLTFFISDSTVLNTLLIWLLVPLGYILQANYLFIALEKNFVPAICALFSRVLTVVLIYLFLGGEDQYYLLPLLIGGSYVLSGMMSMSYAVTRLKVGLCAFSKHELINNLYNGKEIFLGNVSVFLYRDVNILILGVMGNNALLISSFSLASKVINALQALTRPINQYFFPKVVEQLQGMVVCRGSFFIILRNCILQFSLFTSVTILGVCVFILFNYFFLNVFDVKVVFEAVTYILIMLIGVYTGVANFMFGSVGLTVLFAKKYYAFAILTTGLVCLMFGFLLVYLFQGVGAAINFALGEVFLFGLISFKYLYRKKG